MEKKKINEIISLSNKVETLSSFLALLIDGKIEPAFVWSDDQKINNGYTILAKEFLSKFKDEMIQKTRAELLETKDKLERM